VRLVLRVAGSPVAVATLTILTLTWAVCQLAHPLLAVAGFVVLAGVLVGIRFRWPGFLERWIRLPLRSRWRRWSIYRYKWPATMDFAELNRYRSNGSQYEPVLLTVKSTRDLDRVRARMLAGQVVEDWGKVSDRLCQTFGAQDCRVRSVPGRPHEVEAWFLVNDPLQQVIEPHRQEILVAAGCNIREVSEWAGHNSVAFTLTRYGGLFEDGSNEAVDRLDALLADRPDPHNVRDLLRGLIRCPGCVPSANARLRRLVSGRRFAWSGVVSPTGFEPALPP
jgi:hypothetical protein